ncbi:hypothetical protein PENTCL1PPCAC_8094, partial [Pristionchus entomophagus]
AAEEGQTEGERKDGKEDETHETAQIRLLHHLGADDLHRLHVHGDYRRLRGVVMMAGCSIHGVGGLRERDRCNEKQYVVGFLVQSPNYEHTDGIAGSSSCSGRISRGGRGRSHHGNHR